MSAQEVAAMIDEAGETVVLRRLGTPNVDVTLKASIRQYQSNELTTSIIQGDAVAHISNREIAAAAWPGPPHKDDKLIRDGKQLNVESCESRNYREDVALHILQVRG